jgi:hypothetical protein
MFQTMVNPDLLAYMVSGCSLPMTPKQLIRKGYEKHSDYGDEYYEMCFSTLRVDESKSIPTRYPMDDEIVHPPAPPCIIAFAECLRGSFERDVVIAANALSCPPDLKTNLKNIFGKKLFASVAVQVHWGKAKKVGFHLDDVNGGLHVGLTLHGRRHLYRKNGKQVVRHEQVPGSVYFTSSSNTLHKVVYSAETKFDQSVALQFRFLLTRNEHTCLATNLKVFNAFVKNLVEELGSDWKPPTLDNVKKREN